MDGIHPEKQNIVLIKERSRWGWRGLNIGLRNRKCDHNQGSPNRVEHNEKTSKNVVSLDQ